ncbi:DNA-3-methyladenine glycosylase I [Bacteroidia bacterium]|nr:DNA-3-methyladenine glycosylase I [Bacteroidia bacterium]
MEFYAKYSFKMNQEDTRRCGWCKSDPIYIKYHDEEWGREVRDDHKMFEFLVLESAQAGLSWITILKRRDAYRNAFAGYDAEKVAQMTEQDVERLMQDSGIIRNRNKIQATISNAQRFLEVQKEFGSFCNYLRTFLPKGKPVINYWKTLSEIPASTPLSDAISKDMKKRGFKFFGTTICYAHLQAVGYVNDHLEDCPFKYETA